MIVLLRDGDLEAERNALIVLEESGEWYKLDKGWKARADKPHTVGMMDHNHLYFRKNQVAVINKDGSPSHNSDLSVLPNHVLKALRKRGLLESASNILESSFDDFVIPQEIMDDLHNRIALRIRYGNMMRGIGHRG